MSTAPIDWAPYTQTVRGIYGSVVIEGHSTGQMSASGNSLYLVLTHVHNIDDDSWEWELERSTGSRSRVYVDSYPDKQLDMVLSRMRHLLGLPD